MRSPCGATRYHSLISFCSDNSWNFPRRDSPIRRLLLLRFYFSGSEPWLSSPIADSSSLLQLYRRRSITGFRHNLGGGDPRRLRRWAAAKPLKVGSLPPQNAFLPCSFGALRRRPCSSFPKSSAAGAKENWPQTQTKVASIASFVVVEAPFCTASRNADSVIISWTQTTLIITSGTPEKTTRRKPCAYLERRFFLCSFPRHFQPDR